MILIALIIIILLVIIVIYKFILLPDSKYDNKSWNNIKYDLANIDNKYVYNEDNKKLTNEEVLYKFIYELSTTETIKSQLKSEKITELNNLFNSCYNNKSTYLNKAVLLINDTDILTNKSVDKVLFAALAINFDSNDINMKYKYNYLVKSLYEKDCKYLEYAYETYINKNKNKSINQMLFIDKLILPTSPITYPTFLSNTTPSILTTQSIATTPSILTTQSIATTPSILTTQSIATTPSILTTQSIATTPLAFIESSIVTSQTIAPTTIVINSAWDNIKNNIPEVNGNFFIMNNKKVTNEKLLLLFLYSLHTSMMKFNLVDNSLITRLNELLDNAFNNKTNYIEQAIPLINETDIINNIMKLNGESTNNTGITIDKGLYSCIFIIPTIGTVERYIYLIGLLYNYNPLYLDYAIDVLINKNNNILYKVLFNLEAPVETTTTSISVTPSSITTGLNNNILFKQNFNTSISLADL